MNRVTIFFGTLGAGLVIAAFGSAGCVAQNHDGADKDAWTHHRDAAGYYLEFPQGWSSESAKDGHVLIHSADKSVFAVVQPFKSPNGGSASEWMAPLVKHMDKLFPDAAVTHTEKIAADADESIAKVTFHANGKLCQANALCYISQGAGMFYAIAAPSNEFAAKKAILIKSLSSFHYTGAAGESAAPKTHSSGAITYIAWKEPHEDAFTTEVPRGWKITGGVYRYAPVDVRSQVDTGSPDGATHIQFGDAKLGTYAQPGPSSQVRGLHEDQSYEVNGVPYTVMHYIDGAQFSKIYVQSKIAKEHPGLEISQTEDLPDETDQANRQNGQSGAQIHATVGETRFTYNESGRTFHGVCEVKTEQIGTGLGAIWHAAPNTVTTSENLSAARDVMHHMLKRTVTEPQWESKNVKIAADFSKMVMQNHERVLAQLRETYERFTRQMGENQREWSNIINNQVDVKNAATGETFKAEAGHNFYYESSGSVVGSDVSRSGNVNLTPLKQF